MPHREPGLGGTAGALLVSSMILQVQELGKSGQLSVSRHGIEEANLRIVAPFRAPRNPRKLSH